MTMNLEPIAMIGMTCLFAGGIDTPQSFWNVLKDCIDVGSEIPKERFDMDSYVPLYSVKKPLIRRGYFLNDDQLHHFDPSFFGITDGEAMAMDPCHRLLLEKFLHLIEDANYTIDKIQGSRTAVYIGQFTNDHMITFHRSKIENETNLLGPNLSLYNASARLSYHFDLHGPNLTLDTACSSSLQAVHLAVQSLRNGEADFAVAGASNLNYTPESFFTSLIIGAISPDGRSRSYSDDANGYAKSEGVGLVLLKRLKDAIRDKDHIYCVIRDIMVSHDGNEGKAGYTVPSSHGQTRLLNEIYMRNNIDPNKIFYIEGHGTGTQVGDPIEANTLGAFFKRSSYNPPLLIGSVKSIIGHTEGTAGVASLIKIGLCMKHRMITPNMNFTRINPKIHSMKYNLHVVSHIVSFPDELISIGINSFGIGGNTAHVIVTEWSESHLNEYLQNDWNQMSIITKQNQMNELDNDEKTKCIDIVSFQNSIQNQNETLRQHFVLAFSSRCNQSLKKHMEKFSIWFSTVPERLLQSFEQLFLTYLCEKVLLKRTTSFSHRLSFIFSNSKQLQHQIKSYLSDESNCPGVILPQQETPIQNQIKYNICFIYSGQGPQWWAMGRELYSVEPIFRQWIQKIHSEFLIVSNNSLSLIKELIEPEKEEYSNINHTNIAQPTILAVQIALTALWISWGIRPKIIIGHSIGEVAAAYVSGRLTLKEAVKVIYHRSRLQNYNTNKGGRMLALFLSEDEANKILIGHEDKVQIAAINSPKSVTLSGDGIVLEKIYNDLSMTKPNVFKSWLRIQNAFHSKQMERFNIYEELLNSLTDINGNDHNIEFDEICSNAILYSTVTGTRSDTCVLNGEYWWKNIRNPVLFDNAIQSILYDMTRSNGIPIFIEISPHPVLSAAIPDCFNHFNRSQVLSSFQSPLIIHSLKRKENEQQTILSSLCRLYSFFGLNLIDWNKFWNSRSYTTIASCHNEILKEIFSSIDKLPQYTFNHQICWYEPKDSVFTRRAIRKIHHPLLGYRLWHNEARTPTWKNIFTLNKHSTNLAYLFDHKIQENILFPASGFIELVVAAINQLLFLLSLQQQQSITLQNIQFLNGLNLKEDDTIQIETVIIMPFREFYIYSRRKYFNDSVRLAGISGNDITTMFSDENFLHAYSSKEWTLHCRGSINLDIDASLISSMYDIDSILYRLSSSNNNNTIVVAKNENEIKHFYNYCSFAGLNYGPRFQCIKTLHRTYSEVLSEIIIPPTLLQDQNIDQQQYIYHPAILDACFQGMVSIIPGKFYETNIPMSIDELIVCDRKKSIFSILQEETNNKLYAFQSLNLSTKEIASKKTHTTDILIFSTTNESLSSSTSKADPIMIFRGFKLQNYYDQIITKSIFQRIDESTSICNNNPKKIVDTDELIDHFCAYEYWKPTELKHNPLELLPQSTKTSITEQLWIIFCDQKQNIGKQIANILSQHQVNNENITLIYLSTEENKNFNSMNSFKQIIIHDTSSISTTIRNIIQQNILLKHSLLNILFAWPLDLPTFNHDDTTNRLNFQAQEDIGCGILMHIIQSIYETKFDNYPNIFVLTQNSQLPVNRNNRQNFNITQSPIIGFARSLINEYTMNHMKLIDIQSSNLSVNLFNSLINEMYSTIYSSSNSSHDEEVILSSSENINIIQRYLPMYAMIQPSKYSKLNNMKTTIIPKYDADRINFQLQVPKSRLISDLKWICSNNHTNTTMLTSTQVEIRVHCVGISFRDMLKVRGLYPYTREIGIQYDDNDKTIGMDFSGIIVRKGAEVNLNLNNRVFGMIATNGAFKSHIILDQNDIVEAPSNFTMEQLCTLPTFIAAIYCLRDCVQLHAGQTILIHAAAGATGLAFIQYCHMIGVNIIATAGTKEKRRFLREKYQIQHVFNSRNLSFVTKIRQIAPNGVVDVIVNSLSGTFIHESLKLLAPLGHFIELGKRDIYANSKLSLFSLRTGCNFHVIDLVTLQKYCPQKIQALLQDISILCKNERLKPIVPMKEFEPSEIQQAFSIYSQATHIGKFVVRITESDKPLQIENDESVEQLQQQRQVNMFSNLVCNHGTIVISGGLGGLGIEMSKWMIKERGVKRIVLLSRRDIEELDHDSLQFNDWMNLIQVAKQYNASVIGMKADVRELSQVVEVLRRINENKDYPVRGIIHSAMVLHDGLLKHMTQEILSKVMQPKIRGAWNLHRATEILSCPISFFIMFSSLRNHIADLGQSNYNAGNNFLDALAYWRLNCRNLPALSVSLPAISGAGYLHNNAESIVKLMQEQGILLMPAIYVFKMIEKLHYIQQQQQVTETVNLSAPVMFVVDWKMLLSMNLPSRLVNIANEYINTKEKQETPISSNNDDQSTLDIDKITSKIRLQVSKLFGSLNVDRIISNRPLIHQGMDSLIAVELRSWLSKEMSVNIPIVELLQGMSIDDLVLYTRNKLLNRQVNTNTASYSNNTRAISSTKTDYTNTNENSLLNIEKKNIVESQICYTGTSLISPLHYPAFKPPLFCIHDIIGLSQTFIQFAIQIKETYQTESPSVFAFRASGYESGEPFFQSIEIIAEEYIFQMKRIQPTGPYNLLGYSFGGLVAYEMVRQLYKKHGATVRSLILIDPPIPIQTNVVIPQDIDKNQFWSMKTFGFIYSYLMKDKTFNNSIDHVLNSSLSEQESTQILHNIMQTVLPTLKERFRISKKTDEESLENQKDLMAKTIFEVIKAQTIAKENYTYDSATNSIESVRPNNAIMFTLKQNNQTLSNETKHRVWKTLLPDLKIEQVYSTHDTLLEPPTVNVIVDHLKAMNIL
ncbi:unnamed protein product [Rotaria sp. Silwood2]|nr:unnamed protein product [Rotaria sp. Silwood2]